jgi:hypothetical protein
MSIRIPTLLTAGLLGALLAAGSFATVQAGEGCENGKKKGDSTSTLWCPATTAASETVVVSSARP